MTGESGGSGSEESRMNKASVNAGRCAETLQEISA